MYVFYLSKYIIYSKDFSRNFAIFNISCNSCGRYMIYLSCKFHGKSKQNQISNLYNLRSNFLRLAKHFTDFSGKIREELFWTLIFIISLHLLLINYPVLLTNLQFCRLGESFPADWVWNYCKLSVVIVNTTPHMPQMAEENVLC